MRKMIIIAFTVIFTFLYVVDIFAFQFENYEWGENSFLVKTQLNAERKNILSDAGDKIVYNDELFGRACEVNLFFIPKILLLAYIEIVWNSPEAGPEVHDILARKYGEPNQEKDYIEKYIWFSDTQNLKVVLDYSSGEVKLAYYGGKYYSEYQKALSQAYPEELDKL